MAYGEFILDLHPNKLRITVGGGVNEESIKRVLRRASYNRRTSLRERPQLWAAYLIRELFKLSKYLEVDTNIPSLTAGYRVSISLAASRQGLHLSIREIKTANRKIRKHIIYDGSFFLFCGNSEPVFADHQKPNAKKLTRKGRLDHFREKYREAHGYYPEEEKPSSVKRYSPLQRRLNEKHLRAARKATRISEAAASRRARKQLIREKGVRFPKFKIKDHYETPPDEV